MKQIQLTKGNFALVDDDDYPLLSKYKWIDNNGYAARARRIFEDKSKTGGLVMMHRQILSYPSNDVDHINGCRNDNRKCNLRACTRQENIQNSKKRTTSASKYKGVNKHQKGWQAFIWINGKNKSLGLFKIDDEEAAARAYDKAAKELLGAYARLNFPDN